MTSGGTDCPSVMPWGRQDFHWGPHPVKVIAFKRQNNNWHHKPQLPKLPKNKMKWWKRESWHLDMLTSWHRVKHVKLWTMQQSLAAEWHGHHHARQSNLSYRVGTCQVVAMDHHGSPLFFDGEMMTRSMHTYSRIQTGEDNLRLCTPRHPGSPPKKKTPTGHPKAPCVRSEKSNRTGTDRTWAPGWTCLTYVYIQN